MSTTSPDQALLYAALQGGVSARTWNAMVAESELAPDLRGIDLAGYDLRGFKFTRCDLSDAKLDECRADDVDFDESIFDGASFRRANLVRASFRRGRGEQTNFSGADLTHTDFSWCSLKGAHLVGVELARVGLWKTDLRGANYDRFEPKETQDFLHDGLAHPSQTVPLSQLVARVGGLSGHIYRLADSVENTEVQVPAGLLEDPVAQLSQVLKSLKLKIDPVIGSNRQVSYWEIRPKYRC